MTRIINTEIMPDEYAQSIPHEYRNNDTKFTFYQDIYIAVHKDLPAITYCYDLDEWIPVLPSIHLCKCMGCTH